MLGKLGIVTFDEIVGNVGKVGKLGIVTFDEIVGNDGIVKVCGAGTSAGPGTTGPGILGFGNGGGEIAAAVPVRPQAPRPTIAPAAANPAAVLMLLNRIFKAHPPVRSLVSS